MSGSSPSPAAALIVAALPWEARTVLESVVRVHSETRTGGGARVVRGTTGAGSEVAVLTTGMGPDRAASATAWALAVVRPAVVVSLGCAGGLDPALRTGDLVVASEIVGAGSRVSISPDWIARLERAAESAHLRAVAGPLLTSPVVLGSAAEKTAARAASGAVAVEMETSAVAACARRAGIAFAAARAVIDEAETELVFARDIVSAGGGVRLGGLSLALLRGRGRAVRELRLLAGARRSCAASLRRFAAAFLADPAVAKRSSVG